MIPFGLPALVRITQGDREIVPLQGNEFQSVVVRPSLDSSIASENDETTGFYLGVGGYLYLGGRKENFGDRGGPTDGFTLGAGYRFVEHDWDADGWSEFQLTLGFAW